MTIHSTVFTITSHHALTVFKLQIKSKKLGYEYKRRATSLEDKVERWLNGPAKLIVRAGIKQNFDSESGDGSKWDALSPRTLIERASLGYSSGPILQRSGALIREALGQSSDNTSIKRGRGRQSLIFGLSSTKALELHYGSGGDLPARPFMTLTEGSRRTLGKSLNLFVRTI